MTPKTPKPPVKRRRVKPKLAVVPLVLTTDNVVAIKSRLNGGRGGPTNEYGLTSKEESFCQHVSLGKSNTEAYRFAYDAEKMNAGTAWQRAFTVAHRPLVIARVRDLTNEVAITERSRAIRAKTFIEERLWIEATKEDVKPSDRLKALELLGKLEHVGAFRERSEVLTGEASTPEDIKSRIEELVRKAS
jgi:hypothetical protein